MDISSILAEIDSEIARLQQARTALAGIASVVKRNPGRPKNTSPESILTKISRGSSPRKRTLSPEARARIAAAQKKRWATTKKKA